MMKGEEEEKFEKREGVYTSTGFAERAYSQSPLGGVSYD